MNEVNPEGLDREQDPSRRSALVVIVGLVGSLAATVAGLAGGFLGNAVGRSRGRDWIRVGSAEDLNPETFQRTVISAEHAHAWVRERERHVVYIRDDYPDDPVALLATCSHLGCMVNWDRPSSRFICPCHGAIYAQDGARIEGPQPRGLTRLQVKIEQEVCYVRLPSAGQDEA